MGRTASVPISRAVLCSALMLAGVAHAQSMDMQPPPAMPDPATQGAYGSVMQGTYGGGIAPPSARSVFVGTIAALLAQGLGTALSQGLGGTITNWFSGPARAAAPAQPALVTAMQTERETHAQVNAGVAYEVHLIGSDGATRPVDPARHVFRTGDRFQVHYRPALPGRIKVSNVNPLGHESNIDSVEVAAGQLATLGPYRFVDAKGEETLKLLMKPCSSPMLTAATRGIVKVAAAATQGSALRIGECGDSRTQAKARTITKTTIEGSTMFALDALSNDELKSGLIGAREVRIALQHR